MRGLKIMLVAGEASGDLHGSHLAKEILRQRPTTRLFGMGGALMKEAGVRLLFNPTAISTLGFLEAIRSAQVLRRVLLRFSEIVDRQQPQAVVLIDFPGFNMRFAEILKRKGIPCIYYFSPSVWAWGRGRAEKVAETATKVISIFPFEYDVYKEAGADVEYVGHPLVDIVPPPVATVVARENLGLSLDQPVIALLPGSRRQEIRALLPTMLRSVRLLEEDIPGIQAIVAIAHDTVKEDVQHIIQSSDSNAKLVQGRTYEALSGSDLALVANGTANLEAALLGIPQVSIYKASSSTYYIAKLIVKIPRVSLPNIVTGREVIPELLQNDATPANIREQLFKIWQPDERARIKADYEEMRRLLGESGAVRRAARIVLNVAVGKSQGQAKDEFLRGRSATADQERAEQDID